MTSVHLPEKEGAPLPCHGGQRTVSLTVCSDGPHPSWVPLGAEGGPMRTGDAQLLFCPEDSYWSPLIVFSDPTPNPPVRPLESRRSPPLAFSVAATLGPATITAHLDHSNGLNWSPCFDPCPSALSSASVYSHHRESLLERKSGLVTVLTTPSGPHVTQSEVCSVHRDPL